MSYQYYKRQSPLQLTPQVCCDVCLPNSLPALWKVIATHPVCRGLCSPHSILETIYYYPNQLLSKPLHTVCYTTIGAIITTVPFLHTIHGLVDCFPASPLGKPALSQRLVLQWIRSFPHATTGCDGGTQEDI